MTGLTPKEHREMIMNRRRFMKMTGGMGIAALGIGLAGCETTTTAAPTATAVGKYAADVTAITVPVADAALMWVAVDQGYYDDYFENVTINAAAGSGAACSDAVLGGDAFTGFSSYGSPIIMASQGAGVKFLFNGMGAVNVVGDAYNNQLIVCNKDDDAMTTDPNTWENKTLGTNAPGNVLEFGVRQIMRDAGADDSTLEVVGAGGWGGVPALLTGGTADFCCFIEPFYGMNLDVVKEIGAFYSWMGEESQITGFFTTDEQIVLHGGAMDAFVSAMDDAYDFWNVTANASAYWQSIADHTGMTYEGAANGKQLKHFNYLDKVSMQKQGDLLKTFGQITADVPDACTELIYEGSRSNC